MGDSFWWDAVGGRGRGLLCAVHILGVDTVLAGHLFMSTVPLSNSPSPAS